MYHAMFPPHMLTQLMGQHQQLGYPDSNRQNHIISNHCYTHSPFDRHCPVELLQLMGLEMPPIRNRGFGHYPQNGRGGGTGWRERGNLHGPGSVLMPPPPHVGFRPANNTSVKKNYWNKNNMARPPRCMIRDTNATDTSYSSDSGFSSRSPTPIKHQMGDQAPSDDSAEDTTSGNTTVDSSKGLKRLHEVYAGSSNHCGNGTNGEQPCHQFYQNHLHQPTPQGYQFYSHQQGQARCESPLSPCSPHQGGGSYQSKRRYHSGRHSPPMLHRPQRGRRMNGMLLPVPQGVAPFYTAPDRFLSRAHLMQVTRTPSQLTTGSEWDKLSEGIWTKFIMNQQTEETYKKKMILWKELYLFIRSTFPRYGLFLVGSTMSGFGSDKSDVDMCLLVRHSEMDQRNEAVGHLEQILKYLRRCEFIAQPELIQAKVPILKFRDAHQGLEVDLNCNNAVGIRNTHLLYCYSQLDWRVRPLVLIVKLWAHKHNINDAKNMTISSYSLVLMVIHFLQCGVSPPVLPCLHVIYQGKFSPHSDILSIDIHEDMRPFNSENKQTLGELLFEFLRYYVEFDFSQYAISIRLASKVPIEECRRARSYKNDPHQWKYLCIEEPFDLTNTARSVYDRDVFEKVKAVFLASYNNLKKTRDISSIFCLDEKD
ncbi:poly(A) RNA polymerase gld-2 homolog A [Anabrus simplex]|uniref:poly(A) RNA polymerase gld-2 homolog A n=1 Tax=Anabrus simplex TaxID=316456 RepID=UPI0034DD8C25